MITKKSSARKYLENILGGPQSFGEMIENVRKSDDISQIDLAKKMKITRAHLCDIEKGRRNVSIGRAVRFATLLGYSVHLFVAKAMEDELSRAGIKARVRLDAA